MTGLSPYPLFDRLIVLRACLGMLKELLEIYALKPSWDKNLVLLAKVILNTYLAGFIDNAAENGMNLVMDNLPELTGKTLSGGWDMLLRKAAAKVPECWLRHTWFTGSEMPQSKFCIRFQ